MIVYVAFVICMDPDIAYGLDEIVAIGVTRDDAVSLVIDAWHDFATSHRLDPESVHAEEVAVVAGVSGDVFMNRIKAN